MNTRRLIGVLTAVALLAASIVAAVAARDGSCLPTSPEQCSRTFGEMSGVYLGLGLGVVLAALVLWVTLRRRA